MRFPVKLTAVNLTALILLLGLMVSIPVFAQSESELPDALLVFQSGATGVETEIYIMDVSSGEVKQLTDNDFKDEHPVWSPDGKQILYTSVRPVDGSADELNSNIYVMNADGSNLKRLTDDPARDAFAVWSPDGKMIAFQSERTGVGQVFIMNIDGSNQQNISDGTGYDYYPTWSPDSRQIAFYSYRNDQDGEIYMVDLDSGEQTNISDHAASDISPAWSHDGQYIAFTSYRLSSNIAQIFAADLETGEIIQLTDDMAFKHNALKWSPDDTWIAYTIRANNDDDHEIVIQNLETGETIQLTDNNVSDNYPDWRPQ